MCLRTMLPCVGTSRTSLHPVPTRCAHAKRPLATKPAVSRRCSFFDVPMHTRGRVGVRGRSVYELYVS